MQFCTQQMQMALVETEAVLPAKIITKFSLRFSLQSFLFGIA
jgi:hypothetical protein